MANDSDNIEPVLRNTRHQRFDQAGQKFVRQTEKLEKRAQARRSQEKKDKKQPPGGFDDTPVPWAEPGYTLKFTLHRAHNLPFADINTLSSDPYVIATLYTALTKRHKDDPDLNFRTPTVHRNTNPTWDAEWIVANVPASGFYLKCRIYDEDPADHDDRLGNVHVDVSDITETWSGINEQTFDVKKRMGSKRAYLVRGCAFLFIQNVKMDGEMVISVENLGRTPDESGGRAYTIGPLFWYRHFSPLIGRLTGTKDTDDEADQDGKRKTQKYNFQAIQMQLSGPVPAELYHRYVEFKPFVAGMFTSHSLRGRILNRALHHQHARIYNYDRSTIWGVFPKPNIEVTKKFLEFVHHDQGGRIFTYVITLDGQWRFTETGKEFGIDLLSKHTMHSDVSIYIAYSGEFFIRKLRHPPPPKEEREQNLPGYKTDTASIEPPAAESENLHKHDAQSHSPVTEPNKDPRLYELIIDNDSGTYRPNAKKLSLLKEFMEKNLPDLKVRTLDCQADEEKMNKLKNQQRERKKQGDQVAFQQNHSDSSLSSSDKEELDRRAAEMSGGMGGKRKDRIWEEKEDMEETKAEEAGGSRDDGATERDDAPIVNGQVHQDSGMQEQEPVSGEKTDGHAIHPNSELTNGERSETAGEVDHLHHQEKHQEKHQEPVLDEKVEDGHGHVQLPNAMDPNYSQTSATG